MLEVDRLERRYGRNRGVTDVSFSVGPGEVLGLLGPNGAGKTTTVKVLAGVLWPTGGTARVCGYDVVEAALHARRRTGYVPEDPPLYDELRVAEYVAFFADLHGVPGDARGDAVDDALRRLRVDSHADRRIGQLSHGYRQRVALAAAIVHDPPVLLLDEPTSGLDPEQIADTRQLLSELAGDHTVLLSTHVLNEVSELADRAVILHDGMLVASGHVADLERGGSLEDAFLRAVRGPR